MYGIGSPGGLLLALGFLGNGKSGWSAIGVLLDSSLRKVFFSAGILFLSGSIL